MASPQDTVILGRQAGQTTTPDWITLTRVSSQAKDVYKILRMHVETFAGSGLDPFPAQELIAAIMGCSQGAVSRYVKELVDIGAVETARRRVSGGGLQYRLHLTPPEGYTGPTTLAEYIPTYLAAKAAANATKANGESNVGPTNATNVPPTNAPNVVPRQTNARQANVAPTNGTNVRGTNGETFGATNGATRSTNANANDAGPHADAFASLLKDAEQAGILVDDISATRKLRSKLLPMLKAGYPVGQLRAAMLDIAGANSKIAVSLTKLDDLAAARRRDEAIKANAAADRPPVEKCAKPGPGHNLWPADNCQECAANERDERLRAEGKHVAASRASRASEGVFAG